MTLLRIGPVAGSLVVWFCFVGCVGDSPTTNPSLDAGGSDAPATDAPVGDGGGGAPVTGTVVDPTGALVEGAKILVGTASTTSAADGSFTVADVPATYDLDLVSPDKTVTSFRGLKTRAPRILIQATQQRIAPVTGSVTGLTQGPNEALQIFFAGNETIDSYASGAVQPTYTSSISWKGEASATGALLGLAYTTDGNGTVTKLVSLAPFSANTTVKAGVGVTKDLSFTTMTSASIAVTLNFLTAGTTSLVFARMHTSFLPLAGHQYLTAKPASATSTTVPTLQFSGAKYDVGATHEEVVGKEFVEAWVSNVDANATVTLTGLGSYGHIQAPPDGATGVSTTTPFTWTNAPGVFVLDVGCGSSGYSLRLVTAATNARLPDVSSLGLALPTNTQCNFSVSTYATHSSVDDWAGDTAMRAAIGTSTHGLAYGKFTTK